MFPIRLSNDLTWIEKYLSVYNPNFGDEHFPEDSLGGLLVAAKDRRVGWRTDVTEGYYRVAVVITDAAFRYPGDKPQVCKYNVLKQNDGDGYYNHLNEVSDA